MSVYRAYIVGRHSQFIQAVEIDCADDQAAVESAKQLAVKHDVELWKQDQAVARFDVRSKNIIRK
jgi:hypothetical protein